MTPKNEALHRSTGEEPIDPDIPICDPHHHLWDYPNNIPENLIRESHRHVRHYLLKELLEDLGGGHNIVQTVFLECHSMYRKDGPEELRPIGETEFVRARISHRQTGLRYFMTQPLVYTDSHPSEQT